MSTQLETQPEKAGQPAEDDEVDLYYTPSNIVPSNDPIKIGTASNKEVKLPEDKLTSEKIRRAIRQGDDNAMKLWCDADNGYSSTSRKRRSSDDGKENSGKRINVGLSTLNGSGDGPSVAKTPVLERQAQNTSSGPTTRTMALEVNELDDDGIDWDDGWDDALSGLNSQSLGCLCIGPDSEYFPQGE